MVTHLQITEDSGTLKTKLAENSKVEEDFALALNQNGEEKSNILKKKDKNLRFNQANLYARNTADKRS